jgi:cell division protein ZapA
MNKEKRNITEVEIYKDSYKIVNDASPKHTQSLAKYVDEKMKDISQTTSTVSSIKVAVLAALNIADELFKVKRELKTEKEVIEKETDSLYQLIQSNIKF